MGQGLVTEVDAAALTKALVELCQRGHELKHLQVRHLSGANREDSLHRTHVRIKDTVDGKFYEFVVTSVILDLRSSVIIQFDFQKESYKLMNANIVSKLSQIVSQWNLSGNLTPLEKADMPVYFSSSLKAKQTFGFKVGENVVTIYADSEGNPFDYTVFFDKMEDAGINAVERWLFEHGQTGRGYTFQHRFNHDSWVSLDTWGDRTEGDIQVDYHVDKNWNYALVSTVCQHFVDKSIQFNQLIAELPQNADTAVVGLPVNRDPIPDGAYLFNPQEMLDVLPSFGGDLRVVEYIARNALGRGRKVLVSPHFLSPDEFGFSLFVSAADGVHDSNEYGTPEIRYGENLWLTLKLLEISNALLGDSPVVKLYRATGELTPDIVDFLVKSGHKAHTWETNFVSADAANGVKSVSFAAWSKLHSDLTAPKDFSLIAGRVYMSDPLFEAFMDITQVFVKNDYRMRFVNRWMTYEGKGWVITRPDSSEVGLPIPSLKVAREIFKLLTEQGEAVLQAEIQSRMYRAAAGQLQEDDSCWFAQYDASYLSTTVLKIANDELAKDENGDWWVKSINDHRQDGVHPLLQRVVVRLDGQFWIRVSDGMAFDDYFAFETLPRIAKAIFNPGDADVGNTLSLVLFGRVFSYKVVKQSQQGPGQVYLYLSDEAKKAARFSRANVALGDRLRYYI